MNSDTTTTIENPIRIVSPTALQIEGLQPIDQRKCFCVYAEGSRYLEYGISTGSLLVCLHDVEIQDGDLVLVDEGGVPTIFLYQKSRKKKPTDEQRILHDKSRAFAKILGSFNIYC